MGFGMSKIFITKKLSLSFLAVTAFLLAGCSSTPNHGFNQNTISAQNSNYCLNNNCGYEGSYEKGERYFAEQEARRLNLAALERLKRISLY